MQYAKPLDKGFEEKLKPVYKPVSEYIHLLNEEEGPEIIDAKEVAVKTIECNNCRKERDVKDLKRI
jgi:hypothetical protein